MGLSSRLAALSSLMMGTGESMAEVKPMKQ
jgi:hypothetical protein